MSILKTILTLNAYLLDGKICENTYVKVNVSFWFPSFLPGVALNSVGPEFLRGEIRATLKRPGGKGLFTWSRFAVITNLAGIKRMDKVIQQSLDGSKLQNSPKYRKYSETNTGISGYYKVMTWQTIFIVCLSSMSQGLQTLRCSAIFM